MNKPILFSFILIIRISIFAHGDLKFKRYSVDDGLVQNDITCIFQDKYGFIWFGTKAGLSRFDGLRFNNFTYNINDDPCSIHQGWVHAIVQDKKNNLWVAAGETLFQYDYKKKCFIDTLNNNSIFQGVPINITTLFCDSKGYLWTNAFIFNPEKNEKINFPKNENETLFKVVLSYCEDSFGNIWIGTKSNGIFKYNRIQNSYLSFKHDSDKDNSISSNSIAVLFEDSHQNIWAGTNNGLNKISIQNKDFPRSDLKYDINKYYSNPQNKKSISHNQIYSIHEDKKKGLWIGTLHGLCQYDYSNDNFKAYFYDDRNIESINDNIIRSLLCDKEGNLWIGTRMGFAKLVQHKFTTYCFSSYKNSLSNNKVEFLYVDKKQNLYVCSPTGIDYFNRETEKFKVISDINRQISPLSGSPLCIVQKNKTSQKEANGLLIGTIQGLQLLNTKNLQFSPIQKVSADTLTPVKNQVFSLLLDSEGVLWIGTWGGGVSKINDTRDNHIIPIHFKFGRKNQITSIVEDNTKKIWVGTSQGLFFFHKKDEHNVQRFQFDNNTNLNEKALHINCITPSENKNIWVGTTIGLYNIDIHKQSKYFNISPKGLAATNVFSIIEDGNYNLWIGTNEGLFRLITYNTTGGTNIFPPVIKRYDKNDGLQKSFLERSACKFSDGTLAFGGSEGLSIFHPDSIIDDTVPPQVAITNLRFFNKPVEVGEYINGQIPLQQALITLDTLYIDHHNNNFSFEFTALHFKNPDQNMYEYRLVGYDKQWINTTAQNNIATYTNIPYGSFTFQVKASNSDGVWTKAPRKITVILTPPWWYNTWFKILMLFFVFGLVFLWVRLRTHKLKHQKRLLEEEVDKRTDELKKMNNILEDKKEELEQQANELQATNIDLKQKTTEIEHMANKLHKSDQEQLRFFANISHEFRTPLTLILSPIHKCLEKKQMKHLSEWKNIYINLKLIERNAKKLYRLVNQFLDFRAIDIQAKKLAISNNNINAFISEIVNAFEILVEAKGIQIKVKSEELRVKREEQSSQNSYSSFSTHHSSLITQFWFDPDVMEKILYNLISNAIKYTPEGGEILIAVGIVETRLIASLRCQLAIEISDTGIGIKPENIDKIFNRFYRENTNETFSNEGTGIGLSYTKELVELHGGDIAVKSELNKGTTFTVKFPFKHPSPLSHNIDEISLRYVHAMIDEDLETIKSIAQVNIKGDNFPSGQKSTILIIEDNTDLQNFIASELRQKYNIVVAKDGAEGLNTAVDIIPEIIVSDVMMPKMNGIQLCKTLKNNENTSHIPVILLTAKAGGDNTVSGLKTGADDYITKPFHMEVLTLKIKNILETRKKLREKFASNPFIRVEEITSGYIDQKFLEKSIKIVEENIQNPDFTNDDFIKLCNMSKSSVYKKMKSLTNQSVSEFIRTIRLKKAAQLLFSKDPQVTISEIGFMVGFKNKQTFSRDFTKLFGKTPTQYIKDNK